ncbi:MAG: SPOR domain-containing protein [Gammaproteobacteria bacterium]|nr:SPOR domain-containing protein [Gammaproteobacteria bacterium]
MAKDYGQHFRGEVRRKKPGTPNSQGVFWAFIVALVVTLGVMWLYKTHRLQKPFAWLSRANQKTAQPIQTAAGQQTPTQTKDDTAGIHFDFYDTLPSAKVTQPMQVEMAKSLPAVLAPLPTKPAQKGYFLVVGTFNNKAEAASKRLSLLLTGIDTLIVQTKVNNQNVWQIQKGPYSGEKSARSAMAQLKRKGVESHLTNILDKD